MQFHAYLFLTCEAYKRKIPEGQEGKQAVDIGEIMGLGPETRVAVCDFEVHGKDIKVVRGTWLLTRATGRWGCGPCSGRVAQPGGRCSAADLGPQGGHSPRLRSRGTAFPKLHQEKTSVVHTNPLTSQNPATCPPGGPAEPGPGAQPAGHFCRDRHQSGLFWRKR